MRNDYPSLPSAVAQHQGCHSTRRFRPTWYYRNGGYREVRSNVSHSSRYAIPITKQLQKAESRIRTDRCSFALHIIPALRRSTPSCNSCQGGKNNLSISLARVRRTVGYRNSSTSRPADPGIMSPSLAVGSRSDNQYDNSRPVPIRRLLALKHACKYGKYLQNRA